MLRTSLLPSKHERAPVSARHEAHVIEAMRDGSFKSVVIETLQSPEGRCDHSGSGLSFVSGANGNARRPTANTAHMLTPA